MSADHLTPEQNASIFLFREKWQHIGLSTERIQQNLATDAVQTIYTTLKLSLPEIIFVDSPNAAFAYIGNLLQVDSHKILGDAINNSYWSKIYNNLQSNLILQVNFELQNHLYSLFENQLAIECSKLLQNQLEKQWKNIFYQQLDKSYAYIIKEIFTACRKPEMLITGGSYFDFCIHILKYKKFQYEIKIIEEFVKNCGWTFFFENIVIICDRPTKIRINSHNHLHAENTPVITFTDGYSLYANNGKMNLEKTTQPVQTIDWVSLLSKMHTVEIDTWEEYQLLRVVKERDNVMPMQFIKLTNPNTGKVEISRIPLRITSAFEAVNWINRHTN
jgi:hypothetical protein